MRRIEARVTGRVQGVFFRDSTQKTATELGITGWVGNELDGSVRIEAQGPVERVDELVAWLRVGPRQAQVVQVEVTEGKPRSDERGFTVR